jgi:transcriptional regulator with XRE-family HTH domain
MSQEVFADKTGLDRTYISLLERGKRNPSLLTLLKLAEALDLSTSELVQLGESRARSRTHFKPKEGGHEKS